MIHLSTPLAARHHEHSRPPGEGVDATAGGVNRGCRFGQLGLWFYGLLSPLRSTGVAGRSKIGLFLLLAGGNFFLPSEDGVILWEVGKN